MIVRLQRFAESPVVRITCRVALWASCAAPAIWLIGLPVVCRLGDGYWTRLALGLVYTAGIGSIWGGATLWFLATLVLGNRNGLLLLLVNMRTSTYSGVARDSYLRNPCTREERFNVSRGLAIVGLVGLALTAELLAVPWIVGFAAGPATAIWMLEVAMASVVAGVLLWFVAWMVIEGLRPKYVPS